MIYDFTQKIEALKRRLNKSNRTKNALKTLVSDPKLLETIDDNDNDEEEDYHDDAFSRAFKEMKEWELENQIMEEYSLFLIFWSKL